MPKKSRKETMSFGARLTELRKAAGFTQQELADEVGVSRRMLAYYEVQSAHPPTTLLPAIAAALKISTDALLGVTPARRIQEIDKLDARKKRQIMQLLDTFIANEKLRQKVEAKQSA